MLGRRLVQLGQRRKRAADDAVVLPPTLQHLAWVDEWIRNVRPFVFVRLEDSLLIKRPNRAQKLNPQGARLLHQLLAGHSMAEVIARLGGEEERVHDVTLFLVEVKRFLEGSLDELEPSAAVEVAPFDMRFSTLPILSEVAVTYRCNLRCVFCYAGCNCTTNPIGDDREMTVEEIQTVLRRIFEEGQVPSVSFTGGEPTVRPELPELVRYAKDLGMRVNLITNGTLMTPSLARRLADAGLDSVQVSLEGVTAATHDRVTARPGSFPRSVAAVDHLRGVGVLVHTNTTLNRRNLHEAPLFPHFVKEFLGLPKFSMNLIIPTGTAALDDTLAISYSEIGRHLERVVVESRRLGVELMWYSPIPMCLFNTVGHGLGNHGCAACDGLLSVAPNGDVLPCASFAESVGNLLEQDVRTVWSSPRARSHREKFLAHPQCRACADFQVCQGACPLYWKQMGFGELERVRGFAPVMLSGGAGDVEAANGEAER